MKQIFDWLREQINETKLFFFGAEIMCVDFLGEIIDEAEAKWEAEVRKHDIEVRNKTIADFEEQMKFEYRESIGTTKRERHFAEAVIEQVAHSLKISEVE